MTKTATNSAPSAAVDPQEPELSPWSRRTRLGVSLLLVWHISALLVAPAAVPPTSELVLNVWRWYRPYLDLLYLNHGYHFFAPEPGPSHLIRYVTTYEDGRTEKHFFPDKSNHWPRLRYHRHFMLSEHLSQFAEEGTPPELLNAFSRSYGQHLLRDTGAREVELILVRHVYPRPADVLAGMKLADKRLYYERPLGHFLCTGEERLPEVVRPGRLELPASQLLPPAVPLVPDRPGQTVSPFSGTEQLSVTEQLPQDRRQSRN